MIMYLSNADFHASLSRLLIAVFIALVVLSFLGALLFVACSAVSIATSRVSRYWKACFVVCASALGGWMLLYAGQLRIGGGLMLFSGNIITLWFLIVAVLVSVILGFEGRSRYLALGGYVISLVAFDMAVPTLYFSLRWLILHR